MNDRFDAPTYVIGGVLSGVSHTTALVSSQLGRLTGPFSEKTLSRCAFLLYAAGLTLVAVTPTLLLLLIHTAGALRRGAGHQPPQRVLPPQRPRP
jgi:hypothetical protein